MTKPMVTNATLRLAVVTLVMVLAVSIVLGERSKADETITNDCALGSAEEKTNSTAEDGECAIADEGNRSDISWRSYPDLHTIDCTDSRESDHYGDEVGGLLGSVSWFVPPYKWMCANHWEAPPKDAESISNDSAGIVGFQSS